MKVGALLEVESIGQSFSSPIRGQIRLIRLYLYLRAAATYELTIYEMSDNINALTMSQSINVTNSTDFTLLGRTSVAITANDVLNHPGFVNVCVCVCVFFVFSPLLCGCCEYSISNPAFQN